MSLASQLSNLATRVGTEFKSVRSSIGTLASLSTIEKGSIVGAINELRAGLEAGGTITVDAIVDATALTRAFLKTSTQADARAAIGAGTGNSNLAIGTTSTTAKAGNYVPTWSEVTSKPAVIAAGADAAAARTAIGAGTSNLILGTTSSTAKAGNYVPTWSEVTGKPVVIAAGADAQAARTAIGAQSEADVDAKVAALVGGAGETLDTLKELADALGNDANFATTVTTALGNRLRVDAAQTLTETQKTQGRSNLDVYSKTEIGNPETNLVSVFEAAIV
ncbi:hypothetical protein HWD32_gp04 [Gordonia phage Secretariat]|uniref:Minor tail protein n=1 Tax=Gordonia phage Secretariat TaxID=2725616 RepID=A0A6M3SXC5_9CAUD|nr:hypothetical protein HWD32_gp04 [Gordonia phage Secretariat]QJD49582.1 hypothetical protein SEA_SECRETARIAT_4 [Gordonia phage Secretariat]